MYDTLKTLDPRLLQLRSADGSVLVSNLLQGRIFAEVGGLLIHNFVPELAAHPDPEKFNNIGGNSLWPAPEGGEFAYNYPPHGEWIVQPGINVVPTRTVSCSDTAAEIEKRISLRNRRGNTIELTFSRRVEVMPEAELPSEDGVKRIGYRTVDRLAPNGEYSAKDFLLGAWSLEQLPGAEGVIAFGLCRDGAAKSVNDDFYGSAAERIEIDGDSFRFRLGGEKRLQIGVRVSSSPVMIGSLCPARGVMVLRTAVMPEQGTYFNIADNDQPHGPYSAADMFSIFNGSRELNFHELETIAPMQTAANGMLGASELRSTTLIFRGESERLKRLLACFGVEL